MREKYVEGAFRRMYLFKAVPDEVDAHRLLLRPRLHARARKIFALCIRISTAARIGRVFWGEPR
jgi:hypothetical protein